MIKSCLLMFVLMFNLNSSSAMNFKFKNFNSVLNHKTMPLFDPVIEKGVANFDICGGSKVKESLFVCDFKYPSQMTLICQLVPISVFDTSIEVSAKYSEDARKIEKDAMMKFKLYDGSSVDMSAIISELNVNFLDVLGDVFSSQSKDYLKKNPTIYRKTFEIQKASSEFSVFSDHSSQVVNYKTKAHFLGGHYKRGIHLEDIQQYMFFMVAGPHSSEYISVISTEKMMNSEIVFPDENEITTSKLCTLIDDVKSGKITIKFPDGTVYKSLKISKDTLMQNKCEILFKLDE